MKRFLILLKYQIWQMTISPSTYIVAVLFLGFMGMIYLFALVDVSRTASDYSPIANFLSIFWVPVLFMVPLLTMRTLADERRAGTLEALMTTPVTAWQIVFAKFLACYLFYILLWLTTIIYPLISRYYLPQIASDTRFFDIVQIASGYLFIFASGAMYIAIGIFASSMTRTTLVAGMLSFCILFLTIIGSGLLSKFPLPQSVAWLSLPSEYMQTFKQFDDFISSLWDTRPFFFYFSTTIMLLAITSLVTESRNK